MYGANTIRAICDFKRELILENRNQEKEKEKEAEEEEEEEEEKKREQEQEKEKENNKLEDVLYLSKNNDISIL